MRRKNNQNQQACAPRKEEAPDMSEFIRAIGKNYRPALSPQDTTHWFTTREVLTAVREISPGIRISEADVFGALRDAGYEFCCRPGSQGLVFRWMFKSIS